MSIIRGDGKIAVLIVPLKPLFFGKCQGEKKGRVKFVYSLLINLGGDRL